MVIQVVGTAAGTAARGAVAGARVVASTGTRVAAKGVSSAARGTEKSAGVAVKTSMNGMRTGAQITKQTEKVGYRFGRAITGAVREEGGEAEIEKYGYSTRANPKRFSHADPRRSLARAYNAAPIPGAVKRAAREMLPTGTKTQATRMGPTTRSPGWMRRRNAVNKASGFAGFQKNPSEPRISKNEGRVMVGVAILFDLLPLLLIIGPIIAIFAAVGENPDCSWRDGVYDYAVCKAAGITVLLGGAAAMVAIVFYSPAIYAFGSVFSVVLGVLIFGVWFGLFKRVSPFSLFGYMIFEVIPLANMLPMFTLGVWKCVRGAQREDEQRAGNGASSRQSEPEEGTYLGSPALGTGY